MKSVKVNDFLQVDLQETLNHLASLLFLQSEMTSLISLLHDLSMRIDKLYKLG